MFEYKFILPYLYLLKFQSTLYECITLIRIYFLSTWFSVVYIVIILKLQNKIYIHIDFTRIYTCIGFYFNGNIDNAIKEQIVYP